ncbi:hypothetical protein BH09ACT4_BH09ACT4_01490 [soil metagenome]
MTTTIGTGGRGVVAALVPNVTPASSAGQRRRQLAEAYPVLTFEAAWLIHAVLGPGLPNAYEVESLVRVSRHEGTEAAVRRMERSRRAPGSIRIVTDAVLIHVHDTATTTLITGVQRVAREVGVRWSRETDAMLVGWSTSRRRLVRLDAEGFRARRRTRLSREAVVPWRARYVLPETVVETSRTLRIHALAAYGGSVTAMIGHDAIPLTTAETTGPGMPGAFAKYLAAGSRMQLVAATSGASATEFGGWRRMLSSAGLTGPRIQVVGLPVTPLVASRADEARACTLFTPDDLPLVLCVGSHEPRKNHVAVLHAAELRWRAGDRFRLLFAGSAGWAGDSALAAIDAARTAGRDVSSVAGLSDSELAWAYRLATFTVFPSINEGFGLPVAESLAAGTPVITSSFGSMAEIAARGGAVLVDPRDDHAIAAAIGRLLGQPKLLAKLAAQAVAGPPRDWDDYARELWQLIVE